MGRKFQRMESSGILSVKRRRLEELIEPRMENGVKKPKRTMLLLLRSLLSRSRKGNMGF